MKLKCEYCGGKLLVSQERCRSCGARNPHYDPTQDRIQSANQQMGSSYSSNSNSIEEREKRLKAHNINVNALVKGMIIILILYLSILALMLIDEKTGGKLFHSNSSSSKSDDTSNSEESSYSYSSYYSNSLYSSSSESDITFDEDYSTDTEYSTDEEYTDILSDYNNRELNTSPDYMSLTETEKQEILDAPMTQQDIELQKKLQEYEFVDTEALAKFINYYYPTYDKIEITKNTDYNDIYYITIDDICLEYTSEKGDFLDDSGRKNYSCETYMLFELDPSPGRIVYIYTIYDGTDITR